MGLDADDGAIFFMDPTTAPTFDDLGDDGAVIAQLTLPTGVAAHAVFNAQGKSTAGPKHDWEETGILRSRCIRKSRLVLSAFIVSIFCGESEGPQ